MKIEKKTKAMYLVSRALKNNTLQKYPCIYCGSINVIAHHEDYNKPLNVIWMCRRCHGKYHKNRVSKQLKTLLHITYKWLYIDKDITYQYMIDNKLCHYVKTSNVKILK